MNLQGGYCCPAEAADFITVFICQIDKLPRCFHRLGGSDNDRLREEVEPGALSRVAMGSLCGPGDSFRRFLWLNLSNKKGVSLSWLTP